MSAFGTLLTISAAQPNVCFQRQSGRLGIQPCMSVTYTGKGGISSKGATIPWAEPVCGVRNLT
jgi:hypothetical protein